MYILENNSIKISVATLGAELKSLNSKTKNIEYLWQADPKWWGRSAPHLFPRIGFEQNDYIDENNIVKHGYARDSEFVLVSRSDNELILELEDELKIMYRLYNSSVEVEYKVSVDHPFMIGGHPAFNIEKLPIEIKLNNDEYYKLKDGKIDYSKVYRLESEILQIDQDTFVNDALIFKNDYTQNQVMLGRDLTIAYNSELLGVWSPPGAPFICLEPWWINNKNTFSFKYEIIINN